MDAQGEGEGTQAHNAGLGSQSAIYSAKLILLRGAAFRISLKSHMRLQCKHEKGIDQRSLVF